MSTKLQVLLETTLAGLGYELVDFEISRYRGVVVFMDKPGGITIEDCTSVSNHLTHLFMVEEIDYERLEVSSPGLDRPLKKPADFVRFKGQKANIKMRLPSADGQRRYAGVISDLQEERFLQLITDEGQTVVLDLQQLDKAKLSPQF